MKKVCRYVTGSKRGYIKVENRGVESKLFPVPLSLDGLRGNTRRAVQYFMDLGATHYTIAWDQGVPYKGYSNQYCYAIYTGYRE